MVRPARVGRLRQLQRAHLKWQRTLYGPARELCMHRRAFCYSIAISSEGEQYTGLLQRSAASLWCMGTRVWQLSELAAKVQPRMCSRAVAVSMKSSQAAALAVQQRVLS
jgi:hypothetical protein